MNQNSSNTYVTQLLTAFKTAPSENVGPGLKAKWLLDRRILYVIAESSTRPTVDCWYDFMRSIMTAWPDDRTYLAVQDLSSPKFGMTPYARARASDIYLVRPSLSGRVALLLPRSFVAELVRIFIRGERRNHFETRFFATPQTALSWLSEALPKEQETVASAGAGAVAKR